MTPADEKLPSPLKAEIAGIKFYRTKNGNLLRHKEYLELEAKRCDKRWMLTKGILTQDYRLAKTKLCPKFTRSGTRHSSTHIDRIEAQSLPLCRASGRRDPVRFEEQLTRFTGHCNDRTCTFIHEPEKISACKSFLFKGTCPAGDACHLSHELTPQRTTLCHFFARGHCSNRNCRYAHYKPKDSLICEDFATTGFCESGTNCDHIHAFECPAFANTGNCDDEDCHLPHVRHARRLNGATSSAEPESNEHSEAENPNAEENVGFFVDVEKAAPADTSATAFKEQEDFIRF